MTDERANRKMSAILSADVKGFSRLMSVDEEGTVKALNDCREIITQCVEDYRGRVVDSPGDNVLAEFVSTVEAVKCAVKIQEELKLRNAGLPQSCRMEFRIGVNLGDVIEEEGRIYGDGVNIAARLEGLAEAGGICISGTAFDHVKGKWTLGYQFVGKQTVKNIPDPIRAYKVLMEPEDAGKVIGEDRPKKWRWVQVAAVMLVLIAGTFFISNIYFAPPAIESASVDKMAYPLPDKPSIVVLPFADISGERKQEYIGDGITETLITSLSKVPDLFVIARESSFYYKGKSVQIRQISEELGVHYVLEGSVQRSGNRIRITAQLIDALKGHHLWAEKYDRELKDLFDLQDDITLNVLRGLQVPLTVADEARGRGTDNLEAHLKLLQGNYKILKFNKDDNAAARHLFKEAISLDPEYAEAYQLMGYTHLWDGFIGWSKSPKKSLNLAEELARKAIGLDNSLPGPQGLISMIYMTKGQCDKALDNSERIVANHPNASMQMHVLGMILTCLHRPNEALSQYKRVLRLDPYPTDILIKNIGAASFVAGRYQELIDFTNK